MAQRLLAVREVLGKDLTFCELNLCEYDRVSEALRESPPDAVVHLGQCPSAPYSMIDQCHAVAVQQSNVVSTLNLIYAIRENCPEAHLVKLGTMGEYGTPDLDIPEGDFEVVYRGRSAVLPFPRQAGSWYHLSKVHDSHNLAFAVRLWGLAVTDLMQGVVYGSSVRPGQSLDPRLATRLDFDAVFGTVVHRFCAQAVIGLPLSVYGRGTQRRGFISLTDSIKCIAITLESPPQPGEYRVFNQISDVHSILEVAQAVEQEGARRGVEVKTRHCGNPRVEAEQHYYQPAAEKLRSLGFRPSVSLREEVHCLWDAFARTRDRIECRRPILEAQVKWR
jgi:UDP-sulfoquinovose synthase